MFFLKIIRFKERWVNESCSDIKNFGEDKGIKKYKIVFLKVY